MESTKNSLQKSRNDFQNPNGTKILSWLSGYYMGFILRYATISKPLTEGETDTFQKKYLQRNRLTYTIKQ